MEAEKFVETVFRCFRKNYLKIKFEMITGSVQILSNKKILKIIKILFEKFTAISQSKLI